MFDISKYLTTAKNIVIYKLDGQKIASTVQFPTAEVATIINCTPRGVFEVLTPNTFPNITDIHYLSAHPGQDTIHSRFPKHIRWCFPNKTYQFYDDMVRLGKGQKYQTLIDKYLTNKRIIDGVGPFDISYSFDLILPGVGVQDGEEYKQAFEAYCQKKEKELIESELY